MAAEGEIQPWSATEYGNLALVQEIKKHPCLYNNTIPEYSRKDITGKAWQEIADKFECSVSIVKKQWKDMRCAYAKDVRLLKEGKKKPHPMTEHLNFIRPFMVKFQQSNIQQNFQDDAPDILHAKFNKSFPTLRKNPYVFDFDYGDIDIAEFVLVDGGALPTEGAECIPSVGNDGDCGLGTESYRYMNGSESCDNKCEACLRTPKLAIKHICHNTEYGNPRLHYLESLFPEVDEMTGMQFRDFQKKMLELVDEVKKAAF